MVSIDLGIKLNLKLVLKKISGLESIIMVLILFCNLWEKRKDKNGYQILLLV
jgi:hypothetical protein